VAPRRPYAKTVAARSWRCIEGRSFGFAESLGGGGRGRVHSHGRQKVLFGSNHPAWPPQQCLEDLDSLNLDEETKELFLYRNAQRVFSLA